MLMMMFGVCVYTDARMAMYELGMQDTRERMYP